ncbi:hypothetical protein [Nocardia sp. NPDC058480]|uniref:hypothetical protein n=1 Tax=Nocardia sp. NPDC058480 TaxID=3346522 RepID=UPI003654DAE0
MAIDHMVFAALAIFLLVWFSVSAICQIPSNVEKWEAGRAEQWVRAHDVFGFIPRWNFFAPTPATDDLHLLYRDRLPNGHITRWCEVRPRTSSKWIGPVWNPERRHNKALIDVTVELVKASLSLNRDTAQMQLTLPYIATLNFVCSLPRDYCAQATQFLIMRSQGADEDSDHHVIFLSTMHLSEQLLRER